MFANKTKASVVRIFKTICTVKVHCWYIKDNFAGFFQQIKKKNSEDLLAAFTWIQNLSQ